MEYAILGLLILIIWGVGHISKQISEQTERLTYGIESLKNVLEKEEELDYRRISELSGLYELLEDFPEKIAKEIKWELGYKRDDYMGLEYDIKDIRSSLDNINTLVLEMKIRMPD